LYDLTKNLTKNYFCPARQRSRKPRSSRCGRRASTIRESHGKVTSE
jgi:hypothetical protein